MSTTPQNGGPAESADRGLYDRFWEDFPRGRSITTRGVTVTEAHIVGWANLAGDWLPIHVDQNVSSQNHFGGVVAHGPLTFALALGLVTQSGIFGDGVLAWLGVDDLRLPRPVRPGDTIYVDVEVLEQAETSRPERGRVTLQYTVNNQHGETVIHFRSTLLMRRVGG